MLLRWVLPTRYTLRRNTASIMKGLVLAVFVIKAYGYLLSSSERKVNS